MKPATAMKSRVWALACAMAFATTCPAAQAQRKFEVMYSFMGGADGSTPSGFLLLAGNYVIGTTAAGGTYNSGTVFRLSQSAPYKETVLYTFGSNPTGDGISPSGTLVQDKAENVYGTTDEGGDPSCGSCGTVWKLDPSGKETILHNFTGAPDGENPNGGLVRDNGGNLYGTTVTGGDSKCLEGGSSGCGTVFKIDTKGKYSVLHRFHGQVTDDGAIPGYGALVLSGGWLYGTTTLGGRHQAGTIFKVNAKNGAADVVYSFDPFGKKGGDGSIPLGGLLLDGSVFYGTTSQGGSSGWGTVFKLEGDTETVLYNFTGMTDGGYPQSSLIKRPGHPFLYGTTYYGGIISDCPPYGCGLSFWLTPDGKDEFVDHKFTDLDGENPWAGLTLNKYGTIFYGTTTNGGGQGYGVVFRLHP